MLCLQCETYPLHSKVLRSVIMSWTLWAVDDSYQITLPCCTWAEYRQNICDICKLLGCPQLMIESILLLLKGNQFLYAAKIRLCADLHGYFCAFLCGQQLCAEHSTQQVRTDISHKIWAREKTQPCTGLLCLHCFSGCGFRHAHYS